MLGEHFPYRLVRFAIGWRRGCANLQLSVPDTGYFIVLCAWMYSYCNDPVIARRSNAGLEIWH
jgi:hypothetical protein